MKADAEAESPVAVIAGVGDEWAVPGAKAGAEAEAEAEAEDGDASFKWRRWRQHLAALLANLVVVGTGAAMGWTAPALPVLQGEAEGAWAPLSPPLSLQEASWVGAALPLGAIPGALPAGALGQRLGPRAALLWLAPPFVAGWLLTLLAPVAPAARWLLVGGRVVTGAVVGASTVLVPLYCDDVAEAAARGGLGSYLDMMMVLGNVWVYALGAALPYEAFTALAAAVPLAFAAAFACMPESPVFLVRRGRVGEARRALVWLRGPGFDAERELRGLVAAGERERRRVEWSWPWRWRREAWTSPAARGFALALGLMLFQQLSGINVFIFYAVQVFQGAGAGEALSAHACSVLMAGVHCGASLLAALSVDRVGRRALLLLSTGGSAVCLAVLASAPDDPAWRWLPVASLLLYLAVYSLGLGTLPWFMMSELVPDEAKGWAAPLAVVLNRVLLVVLTKEFPVWAAQAGQNTAFALFAACCFVACLFVFLCVPETKGKSKEEIRRLLGGAPSEPTSGDLHKEARF